jgi:hypothetical protein
VQGASPAAVVEAVVASAEAMFDEDIASNRVRAVEGLVWGPLAPLAAPLLLAPAACTASCL